MPIQRYRFCDRRWDRAGNVTRRIHEKQRRSGRIGRRLVRTPWRFVFNGSFHGIAKRTNFDVLGGTSYWQDGTPDAPERANRVDGGRPRRDAGGRAGARPHNRRGVEVACALCQRPLGRLREPKRPEMRSAVMANAFTTSPRFRAVRASDPRPSGSRRANRRSSRHGGRE